MGTRVPVGDWSAPFSLSSGKSYTYTATPGAMGSTQAAYTLDGQTWVLLQATPSTTAVSAAIPLGAIAIRATAFLVPGDLTIQGA